MDPLSRSRTSSSRHLRRRDLIATSVVSHNRHPLTRLLKTTYRHSSQVMDLRARVATYLCPFHRPRRNQSYYSRFPRHLLKRKACKVNIALLACTTAIAIPYSFADHAGSSSPDEEAVVSPLAERNIRKAANKFGTLPKDARLEAFFESMEHIRPAPSDDDSAATHKESGGVSDDSLDAIPLPTLNGPESARYLTCTIKCHQKNCRSDAAMDTNSELLQQLKQRLKKTHSEMPSTLHATTRDVADDNVRDGRSASLSNRGANLLSTQADGGSPRIGVAVIRRPEPKPRRVDGGSQTDEASTGWRKKKTVPVPPPAALGHSDLAAEGGMINGTVTCLKFNQETCFRRWHA